ncbi:hypothetical protein LINGRAHAP2_LOCUS34172 [Linum grandiflorum]
MLSIHAPCRKFHQAVSRNFPKQISGNTAAENKRDMLAQVNSEIRKEEQAHLAEKNARKQLKQEYDDLQKKVSLMETIMKEREGLQDMGRQTSELEQTCAALGEELQKRCACPNCHKENTEELSSILMEN